MLWVIYGSNSRVAQVNRLKGHCGVWLGVVGREPWAARRRASPFLDAVGLLDAWQGPPRWTSRVDKLLRSWQYDPIHG